MLDFEHFKVHVLDIMKHAMKKSGDKTSCLDETVIATILKETLKGLEYVMKTDKYTGKVD